MCYHGTRVQRRSCALSFYYQTPRGVEAVVLRTRVFMRTARWTYRLAFISFLWTTTKPAVPLKCPRQCAPKCFIFPLYWNKRVGSRYPTLFRENLFSVPFFIIIRRYYFIFIFLQGFFPPCFITYTWRIVHAITCIIFPLFLYNIVFWFFFFIYLFYFLPPIFTHQT